jgi:tRNA(Ser,Leu) C12 N-acetylase TAN1
MQSKIYANDIKESWTSIQSIDSRKKLYKRQRQVLVDAENLIKKIEDKAEKTISKIHDLYTFYSSIQFQEYYTSNQLSFSLK